MPVQTLLRASLLALALLPALGALPADADDGRPQSGGGGHPPSPVPIPKSQLGPSAIQTAPIPSVAPESLPRPPQTKSRGSQEGARDLHRWIRIVSRGKRRRLRRCKDLVRPRPL